MTLTCEGLGGAREVRILWVVMAYPKLASHHEPVF